MFLNLDEHHMAPEVQIRSTNVNSRNTHDLVGFDE